MSEAPERRILCLVLPELLVELAEQGELVKQESRGGARKRNGVRPLVVILEEQAEVNAELSGKALIAAVNGAARQLGVCNGQSVAEAQALVGGLCVKRLMRGIVGEALSRVAE